MRRRIVVTLKEIQRMAKLQSIDPGMLSKTGLIRAIQKIEGNFDCFASAYDGICDQTGCIWREDCFEASKRGSPS
jgi:hypothetical protein